MRDCNQGRFQQQIRFLRRQFLQDAELPLSDVLSTEIVEQTLTAVGVVWNDRIYTPLVTLWVFLGQVLSADHSCRAAVTRLVAHRVSRGLSPCSSETSAYCQARKRLPEKFFAVVACLVGRALESKIDSEWLWKGRRVLMFDGSTVSMPDTHEDQQAYPQVYNQNPGLGYPIARIAAVTSLASGAILDLGICRYAGKGQSELGMLRTLWDNFLSGDVMLADRYMCSWTEIFMLKAREVDSVIRLSVHRTADFRRGQRLGKGDHIVKWAKPRRLPRSIDWQTYKSLPEFLAVRETRVQVEQPGFRTKSLVVVTTLLDPEQTTKEDLAFLYRARWNNELDLRSVKTTMQMDILRCKTPELVRKEIWTHVLAYNLIRTIIAQAALKHGVQPRTLSFKGATQTLEAFQPLIDFQGDRGPDFIFKLYHHVLDAIATHHVANRPDRFEPRKTKRRPKQFDRLMKPRNELKLEMLNRVK